MRSLDVVRDRVGLGEVIVGFPLERTLLRRSLGIIHVPSDHNPRGPVVVNRRQAAEDEREGGGHQEQEPGNLSSVHIYSFSGHVFFKHSSDFPSNSRAEYVLANSATDPGGSSTRTIAIELQKWKVLYSHRPSEQCARNRSSTNPLLAPCR